MCPGAESVISEESELLDRAHSPPKTDPSECTGKILPCPAIPPYVLVPVCKRSMKKYRAMCLRGISTPLGLSGLDLPPPEAKS